MSPDELKEPTSDDAKLRLLAIWSRWFWGVAVGTLLIVALHAGWRDRLLLVGVLLLAVMAYYQHESFDKIRRQVAAERIATLSREVDFLQELSMIDPLTGLFNRRYLTKQLPNEFTRTERQGSPISVIILDLDDFKAINDSLGHAAGDVALQGFASALRRVVRNADVVVRLGGDEFLIVLPDCSLDETAIPLRRLDGCTVSIQDIPVPLMFSFGCAQRQSSESPESLLQRADAELYQIKQTRAAMRPPI